MPDKFSCVKEIFNRNRIEYLIVLSCACCFIGFVASRAMASIGMIALVILAVITSNPFEVLRKYFKQTQLWVLSFLFLAVLISGLYSEDHTAWLGWVRIKLPFLFLPLAFAAFHKISPRTFTLILYAFVLVLGCSVVPVLANYYLHYAEITESFARGNTIPMPFSHIRYTLMLAFAFFCCWYLLEKKVILFHPFDRYVLVLFMGLLFVALHILSVRSSLLALYLGILFMALRLLIAQRKWAIGAWLLVLVVLAPYCAYKFVPSLHNKIGYMQYDLREYLHGRVNQNSDAGRLTSIKVGVEIWKKNKLLGVGAGDIRIETAKAYEELYPQVPVENRKVPHNEFVWVMAGCGLVGFVLFLSGFLIPYAVQGYYKQWLMVVLGLIVFSSFFTEDTFEEQIGTGFYVIFLLVLMNHFGADE